MHKFASFLQLQNGFKLVDDLEKILRFEELFESGELFPSPEVYVEAMYQKEMIIVEMMRRREILGRTNTVGPDAAKL